MCLHCLKHTFNQCWFFPEVPDAYYYRTAKVGQKVMFPCPTKLLEDVNWARLRTPTSGQIFIYLGNLGRRDLGLEPRFTVLDKNHSHSLVICNVTVNDSAYYRCVEDAGLGNRHFYRLTVEGYVTFGALEELRFYNSLIKDVSSGRPYVLP